jgi:type III secretory pathway component EscT
MTIFRFLACSVDQTPCPPQSQVWVTFAESIDFAALGITPAEILIGFTWGLGAVLSLWAIGFAIGAARTALGKV